MNSLLAFDISKVCTGWAYFENKELIDYGIFSCESKHIGESLSLFNININALFKRFNPDVVCAEEIFMGNALVGKLLSKYQGIIQMYCWDHGKLQLGVSSPSSVRKPYNLVVSTKRFEESKVYKPEKYISKKKLKIAKELYDTNCKNDNITFEKSKFYNIKKLMSKSLYNKDKRKYQKQIVIDFINKEYKSQLVEKLKLSDNDIADAILVGHYFNERVWGNVNV